MYVECWCGSRYWWSEVCGSDHMGPCARCGEPAQRHPHDQITLCEHCVYCDDCDELIAVDEQVEHRRVCGTLGALMANAGDYHSGRIDFDVFDRQAKALWDAADAAGIVSRVRDLWRKSTRAGRVA